MSKSITLSDIANELGVSISTVHRAINSSHKIQSQSVERIVDYATKMGYYGQIADSDEAHPIHICVMCPDNLFFERVQDGVRYAQRRYQSDGLTVEILLSKQHDVSQQTAQLRELISKPDETLRGLAIMPTNALLLSPLINELVAKGVPVVTMNNDAPQSLRSHFVGEDAFAAAETAVQLYQQALPRGSTIAAMTCHLHAFGLRARSEHFCKVVAQQNWLDLIGEFEYFDSERDAYLIAKQIIENYCPNALFANSMMGTVGCAQAIDEADASLKIMLVGFDYCNRIDDYLQRDVLFATLSQGPFAQGYQAVKLLLLKALQQEETPAATFYHTQTDVLFKTNLRMKQVVRGEMIFKKGM